MINNATSKVGEYINIFFFSLSSSDYYRYPIGRNMVIFSLFIGLQHWRHSNWIRMFDRLFAFSFVPYFQDWDGENHLQYHYFGISAYKYNIRTSTIYNDHSYYSIHGKFVSFLFLFVLKCMVRHTVYIYMYVYFSHSFCDFIKIRSPCRRLKKSTFLISL